MQSIGPMRKCEVKSLCHISKVAIVFVKVAHRGGEEEEVEGQGENVLFAFFLIF